MTATDDAPDRPAERIFRALRLAICLTDYPPGARLRERDLAREFGVSRTPLRQALQRLAGEGMIRARQGQGTVVTEIALADIRDIYAMRMKLAEMLEAGGAPTPDPETLVALDRLGDKARAVAMARADRAFAEINIGLHEAIQTAIHSRPLRETTDRLFYRTARMWTLLLPRADWAEEIGDLREEIAAVRRHLARGDVGAVGYTRRIYIARVFKRLDRMV